MNKVKMIKDVVLSCSLDHDIGIWKYTDESTVSKLKVFSRV